MTKVAAIEETESTFSFVNPNVYNSFSLPCHWEVYKDSLFTPISFTPNEQFRLDSQPQLEGPFSNSEVLKVFTILFT